MAIYRCSICETDIISPAHFADLLNKDDLKNKVAWLRDVSGGKPIRMPSASNKLSVADLCTTNSEISEHTEIEHV